MGVDTDQWLAVESSGLNRCNQVTPKLERNERARQGCRGVFLRRLNFVTVPRLDRRCLTLQAQEAHMG
jgi:hypothetical protein